MTEFKRIKTTRLTNSNFWLSKQAPLWYLSWQVKIKKGDSLEWTIQEDNNAHLKEECTWCVIHSPWIVCSKWFADEGQGRDQEAWSDGEDTQVAA